MTDSEYIKNELSNNSCSIKIVSKASATDIDTNKVKSILNKSYASAQEMQAISCLFNTMFMSNMEIDNIPLIDPLMDNSVNKWIKHTHVLSKGAYGEVSVAYIIQKDIQIIIKIPLDNADYDDILREYFIGITKINSLRYFIPNASAAYSFALLKAKKLLLVISGPIDKTPFAIFSLSFLDID